MKRVLRSESVAKFRIFEVFRHAVEEADKSGTYEVVTLTMDDWVTLVPVTAAGEVVMVRQHRHGIDAETLETPGGMVDDGESPEAAGVREVREETGYDVGRVVSLGWVHPNPAFQNNRIHLYMGVDAVKVGEPQHGPHEHTEVVLLDRPQLEAALRAGDITHALSALALERAVSKDLKV